MQWAWLFQYHAVSIDFSIIMQWASMAFLSLLFLLHLTSGLFSGLFDNRQVGISLAFISRYSEVFFSTYLDFNITMTCLCQTCARDRQCQGIGRSDCLERFDSFFPRYSNSDTVFKTWLTPLGGPNLIFPGAQISFLSSQGHVEGSGHTLWPAGLSMSS